MLGVDAQRDNNRAVVDILNEHGGLRALQQQAQQQRQHRTNDARFDAFRCESITEAGKRVQADNRQPDRRQGADNGGLKRDMMDKVGIVSTIDCANFANNRQKPQWIEAAAPPRQRMQMKAVRFYLLCAPVYMRCDMDVISGLLRRDRHRQPVR